MPSVGLPSFVKPTDKIVLFDAVCKLCTGWSKFLVEHDTHAKFKLCSVQSMQGQAILQALDMPTDEFDTMLLLDNGQVYEKSDAFLKIMQQLPMPFNAVAIGSWVPKTIRNWAYDYVASRRYQWFGKHDQCVVPNAQIRSRFIDAV